MTPRTRWLAQLTWPEVKEAVADNVGIILPIGSTEQHGPHLPLSTDAQLAADLAQAIADDVDMLVAPTVSYGYRSRPGTGGGQTFVGTTSLRGKTLMSVVEDVLQEFLRHGFKRIVLLNWHFENQNFIYESAFEVMRSGAHNDAQIMIMESAFENLSPQTMQALFPDGFPGWGIEHASIMETSIMLYLHPEMVLFERAVNDRAEKQKWYDKLPIQDAFVAPSGTLWRAADATREKGRLAWDEVVIQVKGAILEELPVSQ